MSGPDASRELIAAASPQHPSLLDPTHQMDALFGVVNIPNVIWIDEDGVIVRPPEPGWPSGETPFPDDMFASIPAMGSAPTAPKPAADGPGQWDVLRSGQTRGDYADAIRDWVAHGAASRFALTPDEVIARSEPRSNDASRGAAHFELANRLWADDRAAAIEHFNACHRLQPDNWTYKRQAWSIEGDVDNPLARFWQGPAEGREWPYESDWLSEIQAKGAEHYYREVEL